MPHASAPIYTITNPNFGGYFTVDATGGTTHSNCGAIKDYAIYQDSGCTTTPGSGTSKINLNNGATPASTTLDFDYSNTGIPLTTVYIRGRTIGLASACKQINIEVCGHETASLTAAGLVV